MKRQTIWILALAVGLGLSAPPAGAQEPQSWLHVQVAGTAGGEGNMAVNLPLRAVGAVMAMAPDDVISDDGRLLVAEEHGVSISDIRQMWQEVKNAGDAEFVTLQREDGTVRVARAGDQIEVRVNDNGEMVQVDLPLAVVDALLSGAGDTLNIAAALEEISTLRGDIVRVTEEERQIRVWVDDRSEQ